DQEHQQHCRQQQKRVVQIGHGRGRVRQAASAASRAALSISTATMRETPCSCIVTPTSCSAISIAILLCVMKRNCVPAVIDRTSAQKRSVFASSSGASTSS